MMIAGFAVDLPNRAMTTLTITLSLMCGATAAAAYGLGMGALFTSTGIMGDVMPSADLPLSLMSGAFLRITTLPIWLMPVKYISHFYYTMDAVYVCVVYLHFYVPGLPLAASREAAVLDSR
ncbi:hypothetical protein MSG28_010755 [Choristoneura fumiferana]|uniref:Uncharacterized protein n=1 Tax=Choristoneura fumiferana TaxID=7141 RepID=A0ACC0KNM9_CHOFU|nr:hypothetical protein MSG28_010755 [Choristoneura fumiferana]